MKEDLLSITELAKLRKVTSETLRYYDRIGLMKPVYVDPDTKYRYYSIRQYERLGTIKELRQLGMSIEDVMDYFNDRNLKKSKRILAHHHQLLQEEIRRKMLLSKILSRKLHFLDELSPPPVSDVVFECYFPKRYIITFDEPAGGPREHAYAFTKLEWYLDETAPILASDRVGVYADGRLLEKSEDYIPSVPMLFVEDGDILVIDRSLEPADGKLAVCFVDGEFTLRYISTSDPSTGERGGLWLLPVNGKYKPVKVGQMSDFTVWGIVTYIIKKVH